MTFSVNIINWTRKVLKAHDSFFDFIEMMIVLNIVNRARQFFQFMYMGNNFRELLTKTTASL